MPELETQHRHDLSHSLLRPLRGSYPGLRLTSQQCVLCQGPWKELSRLAQQSSSATSLSAFPDSRRAPLATLGKGAWFAWITPLLVAELWIGWTRNSESYCQHT